MIMLTTLRVTMKSGRILMETAPEGIDLQDIKHDLEMIPGIKSVPELNVWRLDEEVVVASIHLVVSDLTITDFASKAKIVGECLSAYGIHSYTLQPELQSSYNDKLEISTSTAVVIPAPTVSIPPRISSTNAIIGATHSPASSLLESPKMVKVQFEDTQHTPALSNTKLEEQQKTE
ncbi:Zinc homeostasis factor 1 [Ceratocystis lukuohia]|uniref:Zinc homeostasis factor 1 n=1 Tax=Ceratocystis lukuohia TaxID=2019550 RepID=A0ABR4MPZ6_9PEZI